MKFSRFLLAGLLLIGGILMTSCGSAAVKDGDVVKVNYTGTLADGTQFDTSIGREPLGFTVGAGQMIQGFDRAVVGMKVGDKKTVTIPADEAYGQVRDDLIMEVGRDQLPADLTPEVGLQLSDPNGNIVTITEVTDATVTIDANHRLAGQDLTFEIELVSIGE